MKKNYSSPELAIVIFNDVIITSLPKGVTPLT